MLSQLSPAHVSPLDDLPMSPLSSQSVKLRMSAAMFAPGPAAAVVLEFLEVPAGGARVTLMLRIPSWAIPGTVQLIVVQEGQEAKVGV